MLKGFWDYLNGLHWHVPAAEFEEVQYNGEIGLMDELVQRADFVEAEWQSRYASGDNDFPGVWDYDISEEFGYQLAVYATVHKRLPDDEQCRLMVVSLVMRIEGEYS